MKETIRRFIKETSYRRSVLWTTVPVGVLLGMALSFGRYLERDGRVDFGALSIYLLWAAEAFLWTAALIVLWLWLDGAGTRQKAKARAEEKEWFPYKGLHWIGVFGVLVLCYSITFLAVFPGFFSYDATMAYLQVYRGEMTSQHPCDDAVSV